MSAIAGCVTGPDFKGGTVPAIAAYTSLPIPQKTVEAAAKLGTAQAFLPGGNLPFEWWRLFKSADLDMLIRQALEGNPTLTAAEAALRQAQEVVNARTGNIQYPDMSFNGGVTRQKGSPAAAGLPDGKGNIFDLYHASVAVSYVFDIFGSGRREIEALNAGVDHARFRLQAAHLAISGNVVTTVIQKAAHRGLVQATKEIILAQEQQLVLLEKQQELGGISRSEVLSFRAQLESVRSVLPLYENRVVLLGHQLITLLGKMPIESANLPETDLYSIELPAELPVILPSELVHQRPDIQAAEALLHAACAGIGVATADLYPRISLSGSFGPQSGQFDGLFKGDNVVWGLGAGLTQPLLNGGSLRARKRGAEAAFDQAAAHYRGTVISAFQNVADVLKTLEADAVILKSQANAEAATKEALEIARGQFKAGSINSMVVLDAERQYQQSRIGLIQAQAARLTDTAALFQALGGGWINKDKVQEKLWVKE